MAKIISTKPQISRIVFSGIGTGSPWNCLPTVNSTRQIANQPRWAASSGDSKVDDSDSLPNSGTTLNTYDIWNFSGSPAYISTLTIK